METDRSSDIGAQGMYLVTGITGRVGGAVGRHLLARGARVRGLVRDRQKATDWARRGVELVEGDWTDASALIDALSGVAGAFAMLPTMYSPEPDFADSKAIISAYCSAFAQAAPPRLVTLSSIGANRSTGIGMVTPLHLMERSFRKLAVPVAFVRAGAFYENLLDGLRTGRHGTLCVFYPQDTSRTVPMVATNDIGGCIADLLVGPSWRGQRTIELGTPTRIDDAAAQLAKIVGRDVAARAWPRHEWASVLESMGIEPGRTAAAEEMFEAVDSGWIAFGTADAERVQGRMTAYDVFAAASAEVEH